tara:strand:+ start:428 stop:601 length:174 start_codon:yes stop_codon:yes gene_type:complete
MPYSGQTRTVKQGNRKVKQVYKKGYKVKARTVKGYWSNLGGQGNQFCLPKRKGGRKR